MDSQPIMAPEASDSKKILLAPGAPEVPPLQTSVDDDECPVCLDPIHESNSIGTISNCSHYYHESCITTWSSHSNSCPTCRRLYHNIDISLKSTPNVVEKSIRVQDKLPVNDAIENIPSEYVQRARNEGPVGADSATAAGSTSISTPSGSTTGSASDSVASICTICTSSQYRPSWRMISCTSCLSSFHLRCLGLATTEIDIWYCPMCDNAQEMDRTPTTGPPASSAAARSRGIAATSRLLARNRSRNSPSINSRITEAVFRNPASSSLYIGNTSSSISLPEGSAFEPSTNGRGHRRPPGLVIFNNNNELDDDFLYNQAQEFDDDSDGEMAQSAGHVRSPGSGSVSPTSSVINGGVLLRRELRQAQSLSQEESKSWDVFQTARGMRETQSDNNTANVAPSAAVPSATPVSSSNSTNSEPTTRRRRRRKISRQPLPPPQTEPEAGSSRDVDASSGSMGANTAGGSSRISLLINQMKTSKHPTPSSTHQLMSASSSNHFSNQDSDGSPNSLSPAEVITIDSDTSCPSDSSSISTEELTYNKRACNRDQVAAASSASSFGASHQSPIYSAPLTGRPLVSELTLEQKNAIQVHIRNHLRPLYKPELDTKKQESKVITKEIDYININKNLSRKIYKQILSLPDYGDIFSDPSSLQRLVDDIVSKYWTEV